MSLRILESAYVCSLPILPFWLSTRTLIHNKKTEMCQGGVSAFPWGQPLQYMATSHISDDPQGWYIWRSPKMMFLTIPNDDDQKQRCPKVASAHVLGDTRLQAVDTSLAYISLLRPASSSFLCSSMKTLQSSFIVMVDDFHYNQLNREFSKIYFSWMYILPVSVGQWVSDS